MNAQDRKELQKAITLIEEAKEIIDNIGQGEQEKFDNLSEGLQQSEKGMKFEDAVSSLESAFNQLEEAVDEINSAIEQ